MTDWYNEIDPFAADWLEALILMGEIPYGVVDRRSIEDVTPNDLRGFRRCHFFAGIGVWARALVDAGWPDDVPVWTGSCPCQPFSAAGKGLGFDDERHLWPAWNWLIDQCRPDVILGEQVASKDGLGWFDLVSSDLENQGYAVGALDCGAAGIGAPHIRQRLWWVADTGFAERARRSGAAADDHRRGEAGILQGSVPASRSTVLAMVDPAGQQAGLSRRSRLPGRPGGLADALPAGRAEGWPRSRLGSPPSSSSSIGLLADDTKPGWRTRRRVSPASDGRDAARLQSGRLFDAGVMGHHHHQGLPIRPESADIERALRIEGSALGPSDPLRGQWAGADWIWCRDGKYRPVEPGTFPLAHGAPARVGRLRGYGNAIVLPLATAFVEAVMDTL